MGVIITISCMYDFRYLARRGRMKWKMDEWIPQTTIWLDNFYNSFSSATSI